MEQESLDHFELHGWAVVPDVIDQATIDRVRESLHAFYPTFDEFAAAPGRYAALADGQFGGLRL